MSAAELDTRLDEQPELRLAAPPGRRRRSRRRCSRSSSRACTRCASTSASTPRAKRRRTWSASPTSRSKGQEGIELAFEHELAGRDGTRRVIKDRLGRVVEDIGEQRRARSTAATSTLSIDSKVQFFAYQRVRDAVIASTRPRPAAWSCSTRRPARCWRWPTTRATTRPTARHLSGAQLRNRALTDTFEPGSTMKPFIVALALETGRVTPRDADPDRARPHARSPARRSATRTRTAS